MNLCEEICNACSRVLRQDFPASIRVTRSHIKMVVLHETLDQTMSYPSIDDTIGNTPLVQLKRIPGSDAAQRNNIILGKMEGNNPAGSVKDRLALSMIKHAEMRGYKMVLPMPENLSEERRQCMAPYGAKIILTPKTGGMEYARDLAEKMQKDGEGLILD